MTVGKRMQFNNVRAALFVIAAMVMITTNDAIVKYISEVFNIGQIMFLRGLLACAIFALVLKFRRQPIFYGPALHHWNLLRGLLELLATLSFLTGLSLLPIATASTLGFSSPIFLALLASLLIRERVGWLRWAVIFAGFGGVMLISNPFAEDANWAVVFPLACAFFVALRDLVIRYVPPELPSLQVAFTNAWIVMLGGGLYSLIQGWKFPAADWFLWFFALAGAMFCGYLFNIIGTRRGELSFVGPFKYTSIIVAFLYGYLIWGDEPTANMLIGAAVIVVSGIILISNEKRQMRRNNLAASKNERPIEAET